MNRKSFKKNDKYFSNTAASCVRMHGIVSLQSTLLN